MQDKSKIPDGVLNQLGEFTSTFIIFYFDNDGRPAFYSSFPDIKDAMAMMQCCEEYVSSNGSMGQPPEEDTGKGD